MTICSPRFGNGDTYDGPQVLRPDPSQVAALQPKTRVAAKQPEDQQRGAQHVGGSRSQGRARYAQFREGSDSEDQHPVGQDVVHVHDARDPHGGLGVAGGAQDPAGGVDEQAQHAEGEDDGHVLPGACDHVRFGAQENHEVLAEHEAQRRHQQPDRSPQENALAGGLGGGPAVVAAQVPRHDGARGHADPVEHENHGKEDHGALADGGESLRAQGTDEDAVDDIHRRVHQVLENGRPRQGEDGTVEALSGEVEHGGSRRPKDWRIRGTVSVKPEKSVTYREVKSHHGSRPLPRMSRSYAICGRMKSVAIDNLNSTTVQTL